MPPVLETRNLSRSFGAVVAAANINLSLEENEVVGVIGANGAGKTTFVNMVTGYLKPSAGAILYRGDDITALPPRAVTRLGICRSFQVPQIFAELSVLDNLLVAETIARRTGLGFWRPAHGAAAVERALGVLDRYGLGSYRDQSAGTLPQGVRKLLDIAMATAAEPRLILLDEPTSGISVEEKYAVMDRLLAGLGERGVTILFIEHDMEIVERYGHRVIAFYEGRIIGDGPPTEVLADGDVRRYVVGTELHRRSNGPGRAPC